MSEITIGSFLEDGSVEIHTGNVTLVFTLINDEVRMTGRYTQAQTFDRASTFIPKCLFDDACRRAGALLRARERARTVDRQMGELRKGAEEQQFTFSF